MGFNGYLRSRLPYWLHLCLDNTNCLGVFRKQILGVFKVTIFKKKSTEEKSVTEVQKLSSVAIILSLWGIIFVILHILHMQFLVVDVIFYETLKDLLAAGIITFLIYFFILKKFFSLSLTNFILTISVGLSCGYIFAITVPTIIDRSLSAYILEKFVQREGRIKEDALYDIFIDEFIPESQLMDIRLQEAISSGTLVVEDNCIQITKKGRRVANFTKFYRQNLLPKKRLLLDRVTDDLTNPFKSSPRVVDYLCPPVTTKKEN